MIRGCAGRSAGFGWGAYARAGGRYKRLSGEFEPMSDGTPPGPRRPDADGSRDAAGADGAASVGDPLARPSSAGFGEGETWFDAIEDLLDTSIERDEAFVCTFDGLEVDVPLRTSDDDGDGEAGEPVPRARWRLDGTVTVSVEGTRGPLAAWLEWWSRRAA